VQLSEGEFRKLGYQAVDMAARYFAELPGRPVFQRMEEGERQALMICLCQPLRFRVTKFCACWPSGYSRVRWGTAIRAFSDG